MPMDEPSLAVVTAVADREGVAPERLDPPLWEAVDSAALDRVCATATGCAVSFEYAGYQVTLEEDSVSLEAVHEAPEADCSSR